MTQETARPRLAPPRLADRLPDPPVIQKQRPLHHRHLASPFDALAETLPEAAAAIPSMMSPAEREFLFGLAKTYYTGSGIIVDAGTFIGASTMAFGLGLRENPWFDDIVRRRRRPIVSCELAIVDDMMPLTFKRHGIGGDLMPGDSFAPILEKNIAPVRDLIDLRIGDITAIGGMGEDRNGRPVPVEILFLDVLKIFPVSEFCFREYFTRLIPKRSLVVHQDYMAGELPFILVHQEFFARNFEYIGEISSSAVFRLNRRITAEEVDALFRPGPDPEAQLALVAAAGQRSIDPYRRFMMCFATLRALIRVRGLDEGRRYWSFVETQHGREIQDTKFRRVQNVLRACRFLCETGLEGEGEAVRISHGHRGLDHRRTDLAETEETAS